jgi:Multicopper oxidase
VLEDGRRRTDVVELLPATMKVADMVADNPGAWLFHCHVAEHMMEGMFAPVVVHPKGDTDGSRAPDPAFLGLRQAQQSLTISSAVAVTNRASGGATEFQLRLAGTVSVYEAFSVFGDTIRIQLGDKSVAFKPDPSGNAIAPEASFRATNANAFGVVYGGRMEFEATLKGEDWLRELQRLGFQQGGSRRSTETPLTIEIGRARHTATARVTATSSPRH